MVKVKIICIKNFQKNYKQITPPPDLHELNNEKLASEIELEEFSFFILNV